MNWNEYQAWAAAKLGGDAPEFACALGLAGEAGEVVDLLKKHLCHRKPLDRVKLIEELGDTLYYVATICYLNGLKLEDVAAMNTIKLNRRFPDGFTFAAAAARADEKG
jgi:NTP pyrophosphatase (non-canonical NTP hydrolase)